VIVLVVVGSLFLVGYNFANNNVHGQLAEQQINFPAAAAFAHPVAGTEITPSMVGTVSKYAGEQLTTGAQAQVRANDFIAVHLKESGGVKGASNGLRPVFGDRARPAMVRMRLVVIGPRNYGGTTRTGGAV
jgi:hypothetical protein